MSNAPSSHPAVVSVGLGPASQADRSTVVGGLAYVFQGLLPALAPARLLVAFLLAAVIAVGGWTFDWGYLALGGASAPPANAPARTENRTENPRIEAERFARASAASFIGGTAFAVQVTSESTLDALSAAVDGAGRERLANMTDPTKRPAILLQWDRAKAAIERARPRGPAEQLATGTGDSVRRLVSGVLGLSISEIGAATVDGLVRTPGTAFRTSVVGTSLWLLACCIAFSVFGGALARMSAIEAARGEKITSMEAFAWLRRAWLRLLALPIAPLALVLGLFLVVLFVGLLLRVPGLNLLGGLFYFIAMAAMALAISMAAAAVIGLPMSIAAVACGDADAMDAGVRSASYFFRSPLRAIGVVLASLVSIGAGTLLIATLAALTIGLTAWGVGLVGGEGAASAGGASSLLGDGGQAFGAISGRLSGVAERPAAAVIDLWEEVVALLVIAYVFSVLVEAFTRSYIVLRLACDGEDVSAIDGVPLGRPAAPPATSTIW
ncbi:MAG: hypothetical protein JNL80_17110 [Phycisphaerae bacterium]|jgi:hypothetical protein|nr:hypothetical protein [Phycisphaerae bacterium]